MSIPLRDGTSMDVMLPESEFSGDKRNVSVSSKNVMPPRQARRTTMSAMSVGDGQGTLRMDVEGKSVVDAISEAHPLRVIVAGAGVGGLALANALKARKDVDLVVLEST